MKYTITIVILFFVIVCNAQERYSFRNDLSLAEAIDSLVVDQGQISVLIDKSDFRLYVRANGIVLKEYAVVFGENTIEDKLMEGDKCTPEGTFKMISKYPHKSWSKFIWINYPNKDSWRKHSTA